LSEDVRGRVAVPRLIDAFWVDSGHEGVKADNDVQSLTREVECRAGELPSGVAGGAVRGETVP
jgi:hypothetical protein